MNMKKFNALLIITLTIGLNSLSAQNIPEYFKLNYKQKVDSVLSLYENYNSFSENNYEISGKYIEGFKSLFDQTKDVFIYKDYGHLLGADVKDIGFVSINDYVNIKTLFSDGLIIKIRNTKYDTIVKTDENKYVVKCSFDKEIKAYYKGAREEKVLRLHVYFLTDEKLKEFKIINIRADDIIVLFALNQTQKAKVSAPLILENLVIKDGENYIKPFVDAKSEKTLKLFDVPINRNLEVKIEGNIKNKTPFNFYSENVTFKETDHYYLKLKPFVKDIKIDLINIKDNGWFIDGKLNFGQNSILFDENQGYLGNVSINENKKFVLSKMGVNIGFIFNSNSKENPGKLFWGLKSGINLQKVKSTLNSNSLKADTLQIPDFDNDTYSMLTTFSNVIEEYNFTIIQIPVLFTFRYKLADRTFISFDLGFGLGSPIHKTFSTNGFVDYRGYYVQNNCEITGIDEFNLYAAEYKKDNMEVKTTNFYTSLILNIELLYPLKFIHPNTKLEIGLNFESLMNDLVDYQNKQLVKTNPNDPLERELQPIISPYNKTGYHTIGLSVGLLHHLN